MPQSQQPNPEASFDLSSSWAGGRRTPQWDILWIRLLRHGLPPLTQPETKQRVQQKSPGEVNDASSR